MVFYPARKVAGRRRAYPKKKRIVNAKSAITDLYKKTKKIQKELTKKRQYIYTVNNSQSITTNISSPYTIQKLCKFSDDTAIFGTDPNDLLGSKVLLKSMTLKINVDLENLSETEEETTRVEMFIVSLKDNANDIFNPSNGDIALTSNIHYWQFGPTGVVNGGYAYLNKKYFNIHHHKRFQLTNYGASMANSGAQNENGSNWHYDCKLKMNHVISANMSNVADQSWKTLVCPRDPSQNYYIIWFNDNLTVDGESPRVNNLVLRKFEKLDN